MHFTASTIPFRFSGISLWMKYAHFTALIIKPNFLFSLRLFAIMCVISALPKNGDGRYRCVCFVFDNDERERRMLLLLFLSFFLLSYSSLKYLSRCTRLWANVQDRSKTHLYTLWLLLLHHACSSFLSVFFSGMLYMIFFALNLLT